jgi:hypothetical protein
MMRIYSDLIQNAFSLKMQSSCFLWIARKSFLNQERCDWLLEKFMSAMLATLSFKLKLQILTTE